MLKTIYTIIIIIMIIPIISAQKTKGRKPIFQGEIYGKIIDFQSRKPMEYATVSLYQVDRDELITGTISDANGRFELIKLPVGNYKLKISFIGYQELVISDIQLNIETPVQNMHDITVSASVILDEVVIDGTSPTISYEIDKKVIDVSNYNSDLAESAVEILENLPSVSVSDDGSLSLRGSSSFTLLIDGKPTAMGASEALASIPASMIKNIEIITNPSAKYDAEGVSGIINIIMKQNKLKGISLLTNISGGTYNKYGGDLAVNYRTKKHGFNISANYKNKPMPSDKTTERSRYVDDVLTKVLSNEQHHRNMSHSKIGAEYIFEPNSAHMVILGAGYKTFKMNSESDVEYEIFNNDNLVNNYYNDEHNYRDFHSFNANLTYRHNIKRNKSHYLEFKSTFSSWDGDENLTTEYINLEGLQFDGTIRTETGPSDVMRFNIDYHRKLGIGKFESGVQLQYGLSKDDSDSYRYDALSKTYEIESLYSNDAEYKRDISAAYALYGSNYRKLGYQIGIRLEHTDRNISTTSSAEYTAINRFDWFPSVHLSYKLTENQEVLLNYSKRIKRPRSYFLEPFITWYSAYDISSGNPELKPEYIDAFELNWIKRFQKKGNIGLELYYRNTKNLIERTETIYKDDIIIRKPINIGKANSIGLQASLSYKLLKWWKIDLSANLYNYDISGEIRKIPYDKHSFNWRGRWKNSFTFKNDWKFEFLSHYHSKTTTINGYQNGFLAFNTSIKKSFSNNKYAVVLQGRNIFGTKTRDSYIITEGLTVHSLSIPKSPDISLSFSMRLNNYKKANKGVELDDI